MKKTRLIAAFLAVTIVVGSVSAQEAPKEATKGHLKTVKKQFDESLNRFKRCFKGQCTKIEALKATRDLGIAAVGIIAALYVTGTALKRGAWIALTKSPRDYRESVQKVTDPVFKAARYMQKPGRKVMETGEAVIEKVTRSIYPFRQGDVVKYQGEQVTVKSYNRKDNLVTIVIPTSQFFYIEKTIPASELDSVDFSS